MLEVNLCILVIERAGDKNGQAFILVIESAGDKNGQAFIVILDIELHSHNSFRGIHSRFRYMP